VTTGTPRYTDNTPHTDNAPIRFFFFTSTTMPPQRSDSRENRIKQALALIDSGEPIYKTARRLSLPYSTLYDRTTGSSSYEQFREERQHLTKSQESTLVDWIRTMAQDKYPVTSGILHAMAENICDHPLGKNWVPRFLARNREISTSRLPALEAARAQVSPISIDQFFSRFKEYKRYYDIKDANIWNMDEMGISFDESARIKRVLVAKDNKKHSFTTPSVSSRLITVVEAINPIGSREIPPLFITAGKTIVKSLLPDSSLLQQFNFQLARTDKAFINRRTALEWLKKCFLPYSKPKPVEGGSSQPWRLLILDGCTSHISDQFFELLYANRVTPLFLPSHATHILQPLDVAIFGSIKQKYRNKIYKHAVNGNLTIDFQVFFKIYAEIREEAINKRACQGAFKKAGLLQSNRASFQENRPPTPSTPPPRQDSLEGIDLSTQDLLKMDLNGVRTHFSRNIREGNAREVINDAVLQAKRIKELEGQLEIEKTANRRAENLRQSATRVTKCKRRVPTSPNSLFLSRRRAAKQAGLNVSSPAESPRQLSDVVPRVNYEYPLPPADSQSYEEQSE